ncbi:MAG: DUF4837 family protein [Candidatus Eisenbacteria bacterium]|nr:DUF4837 family protein [Candidatus Eisenbacteria bacterium]
MKRRALSFGAALACAVCLLPSCSRRAVVAAGESDDLVIVADPEVTPAALDSLTALVQTKVSWLLGEPAFKPTVATVSGARDLLHRRHVVLLGVWGAGSVPDLARKRIGKLDEGAPARFRIEEDVWADGQIVGLLFGRDEQELLAHMTAHRREILDALDAAAARRLARTLASDRAAAAAAREIERRYGWSVTPPTGYDLITSAADEGFVFLRRTQPDRNLFVWWRDGDQDVVSEQFAVTMRQDLTKRYYDGDEIERRRPYEVAAVAFAGRPAIRISGWWANEALLGGGPFRLHCFAVPDQGRVYIVDESLFAPGMDKVPLMRNLDALAHTFAAGGAAE